MPSRWTHVVTLVVIDVENQSRCVIQDPTYNLTYVDSRGDPLDYFDLLSFLRDHNHQAVQPIFGKRVEKEFLLHPNDDKSAWSQFIPANRLPVLELDSGLRKYKVSMSHELLEKNMGTAIGEFLVGKGYPAQIIYLYLMPIGGVQVVKERLGYGEIVK